MRRRRIATAMVMLLALALPNCTFDSSNPGFIQGHTIVIQDPAPSGANCQQRSHQMMGMIHRRDAEATPRFPGLPTAVESNVSTPNGNACVYSVLITVFHPEHISTLPWLVLAMDESGWVAECETPLIENTTGGLVALNTITFVRGQSGCDTGG